MSDLAGSVPARVLAVIVFSWLLVGLIRRYAVVRDIVDTPNDRSSHAVPTPRGGGAGLVVAVLVALFIFGADPLRDFRLLLALLAVAPTAIVGWIDDRGGLPVSTRLLAHVASGVLILPLAIGSVELTPLAALLAAFWLLTAVTAINFVNFMDGIDGLVGWQAAVLGMHFAALAASGTGGRAFGLSLAAAAVGFLLWNWPRAHIFLGDVGSGSLAILGIVGGILVWRSGNWPFLPVFLPVLPICLDATLTLFRRLARGERITAAHREHLYQRLANDAGMGHARVTVLYAAAAALGTVTVLGASDAHLDVACTVYGVAIATLGYLADRSVRRASQAA